MAGISIPHPAPAPAPFNFQVLAPTSKLND